MNNYTISELCDIHHLLYGAANGNATEARIFYQQRYPNRQSECVHTFTNVIRRLRETDFFKVYTNDVGFNRTVGIVDLEENVLQRIEDNPRLSTCSIASEVGASNKSVWSILHEEKLHPYNLQKVQALLPDTIMQGLNFLDGF